MIYVAYNSWGDLVASDSCMAYLLIAIENAGYNASEVLIGRVTA